MLLFGGFLLFLGYGFDRFYLGGGEFVLPFGTLTALGVGSVSAVSSYLSGDRAVLLSTGAQPSARNRRGAIPRARRRGRIRMRA